MFETLFLHMWLEFFPLGKLTYTIFRQLYSEFDYMRSDTFRTCQEMNLKSLGRLRMRFLKYLSNIFQCLKISNKNNETVGEKRRKDQFWSYLDWSFLEKSLSRFDLNFFKDKYIIYHDRRYYNDEIYFPLKTL